MHRIWGGRRAGGESPQGITPSWPGRTVPGAQRMGLQRAVRSPLLSNLFLFALVYSADEGIVRPKG